MSVDINNDGSYIIVGQEGMRYVSEEDKFGYATLYKLNNGIWESLGTVNSGQYNAAKFGVTGSINGVATRFSVGF